MVKLLLITHGRLGEALLQTAAMISGGVEGARAIGFLPDQSVEDLREAIRAELGAPGSAATLCLVDIPGGSPARAAAELAFDHDDVEVVAGVNLPMVLEALINRHALGVKDLARLAVQAGCEGVVDLGARLRAALSGGGEAGGQG